MLHPRNPPNRETQIPRYTLKLHRNLTLNLCHEIPRNLSFSSSVISGMQHMFSEKCQMSSSIRIGVRSCVCVRGCSVVTVKTVKLSKLSNCQITEHVCTEDTVESVKYHPLESAWHHVYVCVYVYAYVHVYVYVYVSTEDTIETVKYIYSNWPEIMCMCMCVCMCTCTCMCMCIYMCTCICMCMCMHMCMCMCMCTYVCVHANVCHLCRPLSSTQIGLRAYVCVSLCVCVRVFAYVSVFVCVSVSKYRVATIRRLLQIIGLFCKRAL